MARHYLRMRAALRARSPRVRPVHYATMLIVDIDAAAALFYAALPLEVSIRVFRHYAFLRIFSPLFISPMF